MFSISYSRVKILNFPLSRFCNNTVPQWPLQYRAYIQDESKLHPLAVPFFSRRTEANQKCKPASSYLINFPRVKDDPLIISAHTIRLHACRHMPTEGIRVFTMVRAKGTHVSFSKCKDVLTEDIDKPSPFAGAATLFCTVD